MNKEDRLKLKQSRIMKYFIEATNQIIQKDGISAVNIRNASAIAGYSSATLYNYFDNLTHLIFLATFNQLEEYNKALANCIATCKNSLEVYMQVCKCFCDYAYKKPEIYELLFFSRNDNKFDDYIKQYYELYPEKEYKGLPNFLDKMLHSNNLHQRSFLMLLNCIEDGFLDELNANDFNDICLRFNKTILQDVKERILEPKEATEMTLRYYYQLFRCYTNEQGIKILDDCYEKIVSQMGGGSKAL